MGSTKKYNKFKCIFHAVFLIFALSLIVVSLVAWSEMDRAFLYLLLGIIFTAESGFGLYKSVQQKRHRGSIQ